MFPDAYSPGERFEQAVRVLSKDPYCKSIMEIASLTPSQVKIITQSDNQATASQSGVPIPVTAPPGVTLTKTVRQR